MYIHTWRRWNTKISKRLLSKRTKRNRSSKTIDNDVACTEITFGYNTAVSVATEALDRLHTTGETHHRIMVLEVMGRYAGWIALESAIAGGADIALIPEIPYDIHKTVDKIKRKSQSWKNVLV